MATPAPAPFLTVPHRNTLLASATDTSATVNQKNKSYDNIENDRPNDDDDDNDDNCFPCQATQPMLQQDTHQEQPWYSFSLPAITHNPTQAPRKRTTKRTCTKQSAYDNIENNHPDDDNNNDVDCFPWQNKQPVLPQDISPTALTANNTSPSFIESSTDKSTDPMNNNNNNNDPSKDNDDDDDSTAIHDNRYYEYGEYDYNDDYNDDDLYASCSSEEDHYDSCNNPNLIIDMYGNAFKIDENDAAVPCDNNDDTHMTIQTAQRQINAILAGCTTASSIAKYTDQAKRKNNEFFLPKNKSTDRTLPATPCVFIPPLE